MLNRTHTNLDEISNQYTKTMADRTCERCGKVFALPCRLKAHLGRNNPCDTITAPEVIVTAPEVVATVVPFTVESPLTCKACGKSFTTTSNLYRHQRRNCDAPAPRRTDKSTGHQPASTANVTNYIDNSFNINLAPWGGGETMSVASEGIKEVVQRPVPLEWLQYIVAAQYDNEHNTPRPTVVLASLIRKCQDVLANQSIYTILNQKDLAIVHIGDDVWETFVIYSAVRILLSDARFHALVTKCERRWI
jgi:hypothetical protein